MATRKNILLILVVFLSNFSLSAQKNIPIGNWRSHLSYTTGKYIQEFNNKMYCATDYGLFYYGLEEGEIRGLSKIEGFYDVVFSTLRASYDKKYLFIGYNDAVFDVVDLNNKITTVDNLNRNPAPIKNINDIEAEGNIALISTSFGLFEYRIDRNEFGNNVIYFDIFGAPQSIISATKANNVAYFAVNDGVYSAPLRNGSIVPDYTLWNQISTYRAQKLFKIKDTTYAWFQDNTIQKFNGTAWETIFSSNNEIKSVDINFEALTICQLDRITTINQDGSRQQATFGNDVFATRGSDNNYYISGYQLGMVAGTNPPNFKYLRPNGPLDALGYRYHYADGAIYTGSGGINDFGAFSYRVSNINRFKDGLWTTYNTNNLQGLSQLYDVQGFAVELNTNNIWVASSSPGLFQFNSDQNFVTRIINRTNSSLAEGYPTVNPEDAPISDVELDDNNNLYIANIGADRPIAIRKPNGEITTFSIGNQRNITDLLVDEFNNVWYISPRFSLLGVLIPGANLSSNGAISRNLSQAEGNGNLHTSQVLCFDYDKVNSQLWLGTNDGVTVIFNPLGVQNNSNFDAQRVFLLDENNEGAFLLQGNQILDLKVDGAGRKWFATPNGVFLTSANGRETIYHFTKENSPLPDNRVTQIGINGESGEVFFTTEKGIVSYRADATEGATQFGKVYAFPNPVRPGYDGLITIVGLMNNSSMKITDITGRLVYETISSGGTATWNQRNFKGERAATGTYLIFLADEDGIETEVSKVLIVR